MLGKDADKNEYWFFKEDAGKLFIKKFEEVKKALKIQDQQINGSQKFDNPEQQ